VRAEVTAAVSIAAEAEPATADRPAAAANSEVLENFMFFLV
jgi:hypothetical protein